MLLFLIRQQGGRRRARTEKIEVSGALTCVQKGVRGFLQIRGYHKRAHASVRLGKQALA